MRTEKERCIWTIRWMNRSRYKNEFGNLVIKETSPYKTEQEAMDAYEDFTKSGYALQLNKIPLKRYPTDSDIPYRQTPEVIKENERWKIRIKDRDIGRLHNKIKSTELVLTELRAKLSALENEHDIAGA